MKICMAHWRVLVTELIIIIKGVTLLPERENSFYNYSGQTLFYYDLCVDGTKAWESKKRKSISVPAHVSFYHHHPTRNALQENDRVFSQHDSSLFVWDSMTSSVFLCTENA